MKNKTASRFQFFDRFRPFFTILRKSFFRYVFENSIFVSENLRHSVKSDVPDANGPRKRDFHEETIPIDTGETDFRSTVTHFMICFTILSIFVTTPSHRHA